MKKANIQSDINNENLLNNILRSIELYFYSVNKYFKYCFYILLILSISIFLIHNKYRNTIELNPFKKYVRDCQKSKFYNLTKVYNKTPYVAICISALNMENYIKKNLLSIINQSFQDFEIIIVDDKSTDETANIIKDLQLDDERIKIITHEKNLGVYHSRIESILNSKSKYILLMDPDDMYMNENLLKELYNHNINNNFDIIEFIVFHQKEGHSKIFYPNNNFERHYHNFSKDIIYQPELSDILYYLPETKNYSHTICRNVWNKLIRKDIFIKTYEYIGDEYYNDFVITADDMLMNIMLYQFANNYTNYFLPGYLYIIRKVSMSRGNGGIKLEQTRTVNHLLYFKIFYKYIKEYNKDRNILFYEMKDLHRFIINSKEYNSTELIISEINLIETILNDKSISLEFKVYLYNLLLYLKN